MSEQLLKLLILDLELATAYAIGYYPSYWGDMMKIVLFLLLCFLLTFFIYVGIDQSSYHKGMKADISDLEQHRHVFEAWVTYFEQNPGILSYGVTEDGITGRMELEDGQTILFNGIQGIESNLLLYALFSELDFKNVLSETTNTYFWRDHGEIVHIGKLDIEYSRHSLMNRLTNLGDGWYYGKFHILSQHTFWFITILLFLSVLFKGQKFTKYNLSLGSVLACFWLPGMWSVYRRLPDLSTLLGYVEIVAFLAILVIAFKPLFRKTEAPLS